MNMNVDFLWENLDVYTQLYILKKMPVEKSHHSYSQAKDDIAVSSGSQDHIMLVCGPEVTS